LAEQQIEMVAPHRHKRTWQTQDGHPVCRVKRRW
jgi:hypothetical protein